MIGFMLSETWIKTVIQ